MLSTAAQIATMLLTMLYTFLALGSCALPLPAPVYAVQTEIPRAGRQEPRLTILSARGEESHSLLRAANLYMEENPGVLITVQTIGAEGDYNAALRTRLLAEERVDLFHIFGHTDMVELSPHLEDLSDLYWASQAIADTLEPVSAEGALLGLPHSLDGLGLVVNRRIFEAGGISPAEIGSYDELEEAFRALREVMTSGAMDADFPSLETVTSLPGQDDDFLGRQLADIALGGEFEAAAHAAQATSIVYENAEGMGLYVALLARYATHGRGWSTLVEIPASQQIENGLAAERVAVIQQSVSVYSRLVALNPDLEGSLTLLPVFLPGGEGGHVYTHSPVYWAVNRAASEESKALARSFLTWLYRSEQGADFLAQEMGLLSPYRDTSAATANPLHRQLLGQIDAGRSLSRRYREFPPGWSSQFASALRDYLTLIDFSWEEVAQRNREDWFDARSTGGVWEFAVENW